MPSCDMCGKDDDLAKVMIEGAEMTVCMDCARFGKIVEMPRSRPSRPSPAAPKPRPKRQEAVQLIVPDYAQRIRKARERLGLTQEEFAKKLHERESLMQKIEAGQFAPSIATARKLEKVLHVVLVEQFEEGNIPVNAEKSASDGMTLGDFMKK